eukprot:gnl/Dysnectes_brevis/2212_a2579_1037.p1 GENE.gnl/Dysnectes_brevis/2212_a2579_1037~~gnl/Dysnectes_brevis/2212_a2579_1037.p1  ORF type:complete len:1193 (+),score=402.46 gnl/Dysnectes_brevis/2212_a2579_1037:124-3579(+)
MFSASSAIIRCDVSMMMYFLNSSVSLVIYMLVITSSRDIQKLNSSNTIDLQEHFLKVSRVVFLILLPLIMLPNVYTIIFEPQLYSDNYMTLIFVLIIPQHLMINLFIAIMPFKLSIRCIGFLSALMVFSKQMMKLSNNGSSSIVHASLIMYVLAIMIILLVERTVQQYLELSVRQEKETITISHACVKLSLSSMPVAPLAQLLKKETPRATLCRGVFIIYLNIILPNKRRHTRPHGPTFTDAQAIRTRISTLNKLFVLLDEHCHTLGLTKIKTTGTAYLATSSLEGASSRRDLDSAVSFSLGAQHLAQAMGAMVSGAVTRGDIITGCIGRHVSVTFDILGEVVNSAARISASFPFGVHLQADCMGSAGLLADDTVGGSRYFKTSRTHRLNPAGTGELNTLEVVAKPATLERMRLTLIQCFRPHTLGRRDRSTLVTHGDASSRRLLGLVDAIQMRDASHHSLGRRSTNSSSGTRRCSSVEEVESRLIDKVIESARMVFSSTIDTQTEAEPSHVGMSASHPQLSTARSSARSAVLTSSGRTGSGRLALAALPRGSVDAARDQVWESASKTIWDVLTQFYDLFLTLTDWIQFTRQLGGDLSAKFGDDIWSTRIRQWKQTAIIVLLMILMFWIENAVSSDDKVVSAILFNSGLILSSIILFWNIYFLLTLGVTKPHSHLPTILTWLATFTNTAILSLFISLVFRVRSPPLIATFTFIALVLPLLNAFPHSCYLPAIPYLQVTSTLCFLIYLVFISIQVSLAAALVQMFAICAVSLFALHCIVSIMAAFYTAQDHHVGVKASIAIISKTLPQQAVLSALDMLKTTGTPILSGPSLTQYSRPRAHTHGVLAGEVTPLAGSDEDLYSEDSLGLQCTIEEQDPVDTEEQWKIATPQHSPISSSQDSGMYNQVERVAGLLGGMKVPKRRWGSCVLDHSPRKDVEHIRSLISKALPALGASGSILPLTRPLTHYKRAVVLEVDITSFTAFTRVTSPERLFSFLSTLFSAFDHQVSRFSPGIVKVKTIGDAYLVFAPLDDDPARALLVLENVCRVSQLFLAEMERVIRMLGLEDHSLGLRCGMALGPSYTVLVGGQGVVFDLYGPPSRLAIDLEGLSDAGEVLVSLHVHRMLLDSTDFRTVTRTVEVKQEKVRVYSLRRGNT